MRKIALVAGIAGLGVSALGGATTHAATHAAPTTQHAPRSSAAQCPAGPTGSINLYGVTVTFSAPKKDTGGQSSELKPGYIFQVVHVTMRNRGKYTYKYNGLDFALLDPGAHAYGESGAYDQNLSQSIDAGNLAPGATVSGQLAFALPSKATPAAIRWQPTGLGLDQKNGSNLDTNPRNILLSTYKGGSAQCPAGPTGSTTLYGLTVTFSPIKKGGHGSELKSGYIFQAVHVTMRNRGKYSYEYNPNDFIALDAGAREYGQVTAYDNNLAQPIDTGKLAPGASASGDLAFAVPSSVTPVALRWVPTGYGLDQNAHLDISNQIVRLPR